MWLESGGIFEIKISDDLHRQGRRLQNRRLGLQIQAARVRIGICGATRTARVRSHGFGRRPLHLDLGLRRVATGHQDAHQGGHSHKEHGGAKNDQPPAAEHREESLRAALPMLHYRHWELCTRTSQSFHIFLRSKPGLQQRTLRPLRESRLHLGVGRVLAPSIVSNSRVVIGKSLYPNLSS
jgi:hypothetical protein